MQKSCWYCHKPLSLFKSFKGELFCDSEHEKLYLSEQLKRVQDPFAAKPKPPKAEPEPAPPAPSPVAAAPAVQPVPAETAKVEVPEPEAVEPEAEAVAVEQAAVIEATSVSVPSEVSGDPPIAPLFPWPVTAREGNLREPVLEEAMDPIPQRVVPQQIGPLTVFEPVESRNEPPVATALAMPLTAVEGTRSQARPEDSIDVLADPVRPRMGEGSHLSSASDDFPIASLVATPVPVFEGPLPRAIPQGQIDQGPARIDPSVPNPTTNDPSRRGHATPALSYASRSPLRLGPRRSPVSGGAAPGANWAAELSKHVPRMLSFGAVPQPELTPALSSQLNSAAASGLEQSIPPGDAISSPVSLRIPQLAYLKPGLTPTLSSELSPTASSGCEHEIPPGDATSSQVTLQIPRLSFLQSKLTPAVSSQLNLVPSLGLDQGIAPGDAISSRVSPQLSRPAFQQLEGTLYWKAATPASYVATRLDQHDRDRSSLASLLETSLQLTLASVVTLGRTWSGATTALAGAGFFPGDCGGPSESRGANSAPEDTLVTAPPAPRIGSARGLTSLSPLRANSYRAIAGMSTCRDSAIGPSQHVTHPVEGARFSQIRSTRTIDRAQGGASQLTLQEPIDSCWSGQDFTPGTLAPVESPAISAAALQFPQAQPGTASVAPGAASYPEQRLVDSLQTVPLSASVQTIQPLDSRLPGGRRHLTHPRLETGVAAVEVHWTDHLVQALEAVAHIRASVETGLPAASILLGAPALGAGSTVPLSVASAANDNVADFSTEQKARRAIPASLLGLPGPLPRSVVLFLVSGESFEMSIAPANPGLTFDLEAAAPAAVSAPTQTGAACFHLASPALPEHSVILNFTPIPGYAPIGASLAQAHPRRHSPASLVVHPRVPAPADDRFKAPQEHPVVTLL